MTQTQWVMGWTSPNIQSLAAYKGMLVGVNIDSTVLAIRLVELSQTDGTATAFNNIVPPDNAITGMVEHDDKLLAAGNADDALFRMYDVLWDETIADFEVDEGADATFDLAAISQDASIYSLPNNTESWLTITGADTDLVATTAPDVNADTNYDVVVRATRSGINVDETLRIVVKETGGTPPPTNNAPAFADAFYQFADVAIAVGEIVGTVAATDADNDTLAYSLEGTDATDFAIDANGQITVAVELTNSQLYAFNVVADDGTDTAIVGVFATAIAGTPALSFGSETIANQAWVVGTAESLTLPEVTGGEGTITYSLSPYNIAGTASHSPPAARSVSRHTNGTIHKRHVHLHGNRRRRHHCRVDFHNRRHSNRNHVQPCIVPQSDVGSRNSSLLDLAGWLRWRRRPRTLLNPCIARRCDIYGKHKGIGR